MSIPARVSPSALGTQSLEKRLAEVEDRLAIRDLGARYNIETDNRHLAGIGELFTENANFSSKDGVMRATGREAILKLLDGRFTVLGATNHFAHDHVIWLESSTRAGGLVSAHAELWRKERTMITAIRYEDIYEKVDGLWCFASRTLSFMYYLPIEEYASAMGRLDRNRASDVPVAADFPERLPTYVERRPGKVKPA